MEQILEHCLRVDNSTAENAAAAFVVIIAQQTGLGVEDQAGGRGGNIADVGSLARPRGSAGSGLG